MNNMRFHSSNFAIKRILAALVVSISVLLLVLVLGAAHPGSASAKGKATPTPTRSALATPSPLSPANGAQVTLPLTISWSPVSDPAGIVAYNWQVSPSSSFSPVVALDSTSGQTQDTVSGLPNGTYFWRVQAVNGNFVQGAWSPSQSFTVTGADAGAPGTPSLNPPKGGTQFHPMEVIYFTWNSVPGAATYNFDASNDPNFPVATKVHFDNIPNTAYSIELGDSMPQGSWYARVSAVNVDGIQGAPSNVQTFTLSFNAPLPPPPNLVSPSNGASVPLPVTLTWTDVPNPQPSGYVLEIAADSGFRNIEYINNQITGPQWTVTSLTAGTKFWHVLSTQGDSAPGVPANTAWSATGTFVVPSTLPQVASLTLTQDPASNGDMETVTVQLTGPAPQGGAQVSLSSNNATAAPLPPTFTVPAGFASGQFRFQVGEVSTPTLVTLTATYNASSASVSFTAQPPTLQSFTISPGTISGGATPTAIVMLTGAASPGGQIVSLTSSNPSLVNVPATVTIPAGDVSISVNIPTTRVSANTVVTITASANGVTLQTSLTLTPQPPPASLSLSPNPTTGSNGSFATVTIASPSPFDNILQVTCSNPSVATCNNSVTIPAGSTTGGFNIFTVFVTKQQLVTVSVCGSGVTQTVTLTVQPNAVPTAASTPLPATPTTSAPTSVPPSPTQALPTATRTTATDTVSIQVAEYTGGNRILRVEATSSSSSATLSVYVTSTNVLIGTLRNDGGGRYRSDLAWSTNPQNITVRSSLGGSASRNVTLK